MTVDDRGQAGAADDEGLAELEVHARRLRLDRRGAGIPRLHEAVAELTRACEAQAWRQACGVVEQLIGRLELGEWRPDQLFLMPGRLQYADGPAPLRARIEHLRELAYRAGRSKAPPRDASWERRQHPDARARARALERQCAAWAEEHQTEDETP